MTRMILLAVGMVLTWNATAATQVHCIEQVVTPSGQVHTIDKACPNGSV